MVDWFYLRFGTCCSFCVSIAKFAPGTISPASTILETASAFACFSIERWCWYNYYRRRLEDQGKGEEEAGGGKEEAGGRGRGEGGRGGGGSGGGWNKILLLKCFLRPIKKWCGCGCWCWQAFITSLGWRGGLIPG